MLTLTLFAAVVTAQAPPPDAPVERSVESMTRAELKAEYVRVEEQRPGIAGPITLMAIGGGSVVYGALLLLTAGGNNFTSQNPTGYLFVGMIMAGAAMLFPGIWLLWTRRQERTELGERMDAITERLEQLDRADIYARDRQQEAQQPQRPEGWVPQL